MTAPRAAESTPRRSHDSTLFLLALTFCLIVTLFQFHGCMRQGNCVFAEDFEVFYRAASHAAHGDAAGAYDTQQLQQWLHPAPGATLTIHPYLYPPF